MQIAHKIRLSPNNKQVTYFKKACGTRRQAYNWALVEWNKIYESNKLIPENRKNEREKLSAMELKKKYNSIRKVEFPWTYEVTKYASANAFFDLQDSFQRFFKKQNSFPVKKKKGKCKDSFSIGGDQIKILGKKIKIPNLGWVNLTEELRFKNEDGSLAKINNVTISRTADHWFASVQVIISDEVANIIYPKPLVEKTGGFDAGINSIIVSSDGLDFTAIAPLKNALSKLKRKSRKLAKKSRAAKKDGRSLKDSKNYQKQKIIVARAHEDVANKRKDISHKITSYITSEYTGVAIEDLNVSGMVKNHKLARSILDIGFGEIKRQIMYKTEMRGSELVFAGTFFPSTKTCRVCKTVKKEMSLSERIFICDDLACGHIENRDLNAARNLENLLTTKIGRASPEFTPVEITAIQKRVLPVFVTSIDMKETGIQSQKLCG